MTLVATVAGSGGELKLSPAVGDTVAELHKWVAAAGRDKTLTGTANTLDEVWVPLASGGVVRYGSIAVLEEKP